MGIRDKSYKIANDKFYKFVVYQYWSFVENNFVKEVRVDDQLYNSGMIDNPTEYQGVKVLVKVKPVTIKDYSLINIMWSQFPYSL